MKPLILHDTPLSSHPLSSQEIERHLMKGGVVTNGAIAVGFKGDRLHNFTTDRYWPGNFTSDVWFICNETELFKDVGTPVSQETVARSVHEELVTDFKQALEVIKYIKYVKSDCMDPQRRCAELQAYETLVHAKVEYYLYKLEAKYGRI